jgi:TPR repeat protein
MMKNFRHFVSFIFYHFNMASSSFHTNNNGIPPTTLLEWYKIRDTFFGADYASRNIPLALELASSCQHPDALWLTAVCAGTDVKTFADAKRVFSARGQNDARALCFWWRCSTEDEALLRRSADLGFAFAQALLAERTDREEKLKFALSAAAQGERDGFAQLGCCFRDGVGCEQNWEKAKELFVLASSLGSLFSKSCLGWLHGAADPSRWFWWGLASALGNNWSFLYNFAKQVELFNSGQGSRPVMFAIGRALRGHVNEEVKTIFNSQNNFDSLVGPAKQAIAFYEAQIKAVKDAMYAWTLVGIKLKVVKDVRKLIAKLIWESREAALFQVAPGENAQRTAENAEAEKQRCSFM